VVGGDVVAGPLAVDHRDTVLTIPVDGDAVARGVIEFDLVSEPYLPAATGSADTRELGVVLLRVEFEPAEPTEGWWNAPAD